MLSVPALVYWTNNVFQVLDIFYLPFSPLVPITLQLSNTGIPQDTVGLVLDHCDKANIE